MDTVNILGAKISMMGIEESVDYIMDMMQQSGNHAVFTPNSEIVMNAYKNKEFLDLINDADLLTADGIGLVYASKIVGKPIYERAAGCDIAMELVARMAQEDKTLFLFGSKPGTAERAADILMEENPGLKVVGCRNGYFKPEETEEIISEINSSGADVLWVCLGSPAQEKWIMANKDKLWCKVMMGLGGSLDAITGDMPRAPEWWCNHGLEWLYRLMKQPSRIGRMMSLPKFGLTVLIHGRKFPQ
ncbi:MAG: WecB/TagA/CpsF family glycosyltransferase [Clostridia bacterium]|nr:WecB/TagA/CpsF family glycosyltransferase [Clostridia bacterium]